MLSSDMRMDILKHGRVSKRGKIRRVSWVYMLKTKKIILIAKRNKEKFSKVWRRKLEGRKREECGPKMHVDSECPSHVTEDQTKYLISRKDNKRS